MRAKARFRQIAYSPFVPPKEAKHEFCAGYRLSESSLSASSIVERSKAGETLLFRGSEYVPAVGKTSQRLKILTRALLHPFIIVPLSCVTKSVIQKRPPRRDKVCTFQKVFFSICIISQVMKNRSQMVLVPAPQPMFMNLSILDVSEITACVITSI